MRCYLCACHNARRLSAENTAAQPRNNTAPRGVSRINMINQITRGMRIIIIAASIERATRLRYRARHHARRIASAQQRASRS